MIYPYFKSDDKQFYLLKGDTMSILPQFEHKFDMVFADPPYFLSNNGQSIKNGKIVSVNKGVWDKSKGFEFINNFNRRWLTLARDKMKDNATIWISGTKHNIFSIGQLLTELGFKILNIITWEKTNPPPNFSCRFFTYSTEQIIWARKSEKIPHYYNYELIKRLNGGKQMKDVWKLPAVLPWEKSRGKHPTQKPLSLLTKLILASTKPNAWILDPFAGSSTTGIAANLIKRRYLGIEQEEEFLRIGKNRKLEIENIEVANTYRNNISSIIDNRYKTKFSKTTNVPEPNKIVLGFCRTKDLDNLSRKSVFYFHAIKSKNEILDFPTDIYSAKKLYVYSGRRSNHIKLSGYHGEIEKVRLKHKSTIQGKETSKTEFYYEVSLHKPFIFDETHQFTINVDILFDKSDKINRRLFKQYLPVITSLESLEKASNN